MARRPELDQEVRASLVDEEGDSKDLSIVTNAL